MGAAGCWWAGVYCGGGARALPSKPERGETVSLLNNLKKIGTSFSWSLTEKNGEAPKAHPESFIPLVMSTPGHPSSPHVLSCVYSPKSAFSNTLRVNKCSSWAHSPRGLYALSVGFNCAI